MTFIGIARKGITHQFSPRLVAFEHTPKETSAPSQNILIFIGGLFDGLHNVPYTSTIADALPPTWSIAQAILSSSYTGWGISSLQKDVKELSQCVAYFRTIKSGKIILIGHSTGCQDVMEYLTGTGHEDRAPVNGGIIQGPVSDREAMIMTMDPAVYKSACVTAQAMVDAGDSAEVLPSKKTNKFLPGCPISAYRWLSLASPNHDGDDDYFSSDLTDEQLMKTFGSLPATSPLCILFSDADEYMNKDINKMALTKRWIEITKRGAGKVDEENSIPLEGASHNLAGNSDEVVQGLVRRVLGFLSGVSANSNL
ncbi:UPF0613 protein [Lachnellula hyalina]|uniref:UPF0613 protein n=1 Tax=Lachnellula hyalina TaxID=1316788 RepID=A0A8H8R4J4_9HELO|nr:UPF0613 protein [Lachnellula hyalina]TVY27360.1 UPF0613 protein [Lachnellula hyalina]